MATSFIHAKSSARKFGGKPEDYQKIHDFFDQTKATLGDIRHRAILHNTLGIFIAEQMFGVTVKNSEGRDVPVKLVAEQHVIEDCGFLPTVENWLDNLPLKEWMVTGAKPLSRELK